VSLGGMEGGVGVGEKGRYRQQASGWSEWSDASDQCMRVFGDSPHLGGVNG
jgi:hypothetical protein